MPKAQYQPHFRDWAEGNIYLDKPGACTITLTGAASMTQSELNELGEICAKALSRYLAKQRSKQA